MTDQLRDALAKAIYCDGSYPVRGTPDAPVYSVGANNDKWAKTSEPQRMFCRAQADAALAHLRERIAGFAELEAGTAVVVPSELLRGLADDLAEELDQRYEGRDVYPDRRLNHSLAEVGVVRAFELLAASPWAGRKEEDEPA